MNIDEIIARFKADADEWRHLAESCRDDEEEGHKCRFSAGYDEYLRRATEDDLIATWLTDYKVYRLAFEMACEVFEGVACSEYDIVNDCREDANCKLCAYNHYLKKAREKV